MTDSKYEKETIKNYLIDIPIILDTILEGNLTVPFPTKRYRSCYTLQWRQQI